MFHGNGYINVVMRMLSAVRTWSISKGNIECRHGRDAIKTAWTTDRTLIAVMQRKSMGQVRRKQGEQGALDLSN
jgi:hypothetical protein